MTGSPLSHVEHSSPGERSRQSDSSDDSSDSSDDEAPQSARATPTLLAFSAERATSSEEIRAQLEHEIHRLEGQLSSSRREVNQYVDVAVPFVPT